MNLKAEKYKGEIRAKIILVVAWKMNHFLGMFELDPFGNSLLSLGKFQYEEEPCCHEETITVKK